MNDIAELYSTSQNGGELPYFVGKQYGSGWLRTIGRFVFPILKQLGRMVMGTASDLLVKNQSFLPALKDRAIEIASVLAPQIMSNISNAISIKRKPSKEKSINKRMKGHGTIFAK